MGRMESSLEIAKNDQKTRERLIQELKELVMIWSRGISTSIENYNVSRALRLLRLCARLEAIDGCLAVLKVLGQSLGNPSSFIDKTIFKFYGFLCVQAIFLSVK